MYYHKKMDRDASDICGSPHLKLAQLKGVRAVVRNKILNILRRLEMNFD